MQVRYCGKVLMARLSAARELEELKLDLLDVVHVLENGFDCASGGKRKQGIHEKCLKVGRKVLRVVAAEGLLRFPGGPSEEVFYLIHASQETWRKR